MPAARKSSKSAGKTELLPGLKEKTASKVRQNPVQSIIWAFFVGLFFTIIPVGRLFGLFSSLALALLRPVLLVLGVLKLSEEIEQRRKPKPPKP